MSKLTVSTSLTFRKSLLLIAVCLLACYVINAQTIVNYDFNAAAGYPVAPTTTASGVTSSATSTETFTTFGGTATDANAFTTNATAGNAIAMSNSSGTNTRYFQFDLGGASLPTYYVYRIYFQAQRSGTGAQTITLAYDPGCTGTYTNFGTTMTVSTAFATSSPEVFDLSGIGALNFQTANCFRLLASGASGTGTLRIDNFQVRASIVTAATSSVQGTVVNEFGRPLSRATVSILDAQTGETRYTRTNPFGYYYFGDLTIGNFYIMQVRRKGYEFPNAPAFQLLEEVNGQVITGQRSP